MAERVTAVKVERLYSLVVTGWLRDKDGSPGEHLGQRAIRLVAATNAEAIGTARVLLDPAGAYPLENWAVTDGGELAPESNDPASSAQKWSAWRARSAAPTMTENGVAHA